MLLAVSGGLDSVVMVELFHRAQIPFGIAHCNFNLRGKESDADHAFVRSLAKKHKVRFHSKKFNTATIAKKEKVTVQEAARKLRYDWFELTRMKFSYDAISTAHHLDDSIETFFINLLRGTGIKGLTGIPVHSNKVVRPLLFAGRDEILEFARANNLTWREDASNREDYYLRNKIRHSLIPVFKELQPGFEKKMAVNFSHLQLAAIAYKELIQNYSEKFLVIKGRENWEIRLTELKKEKNAEEILSAILHSLGIFRLTAESILETGQTGKMFYADRFRLLRDREKLILEKTAPKDISVIKIKAPGSKIHLDNTSIYLDINVLNQSEGIPKYPGTQVLDAGKLKFPMELRPWKAGDYFYPLGLGHRKKISDYLTDKKISRFDKEKCMVLLSAGDIVCILEREIDDRYKVSPATKKILRIQSIR